MLKPLKTLLTNINQQSYSLEKKHQVFYEGTLLKECWFSNYNFNIVRLTTDKIDAAKKEMLSFFIPHIFLFVKTWHLHYPQSNLAADSLVGDSGVLRW